MKQFRVYAWHKEIHAQRFIHGRLQAFRNGDWVTCGVFQALPGEMSGLEAICEMYGIEIRHEDPHAAISTDVA